MAERILGYTTEINVLQDLIPICSYCHAVREGAEYWESVEAYIKTRTGACLSHGICPPCYEEQAKILSKTVAEDQKRRGNFVSLLTHS